MYIYIYTPPGSVCRLRSRPSFAVGSCFSSAASLFFDLEVSTALRESLHLASNCYRWKELYFSKCAPPSRNRRIPKLLLLENVIAKQMFLLKDFVLLNKSKWLELKSKNNELRKADGKGEVESQDVFNKGFKSCCSKCVSVWLIILYNRNLQSRLPLLNIFICATTCSNMKNCLTICINPQPINTALIFLLNTF